MSALTLDQIVTSLLYEGYILYPYRASSKKNQRERFTFGRVYPEAYSRAQNGAEPCIMQTECLVEGSAAIVEVGLRFIQPIRRGQDQWLEAVERRVTAPPHPVSASPIPLPFRFEPCEGILEVRTESIDQRVIKVTARISNFTPTDEPAMKDPTELLLRTFTSMHTILQVHDGRFLSMLDPPAPYQDAAANCRNFGTWPVLIGDEAQGEANIMLSSPIILYDFPKVAGESPGDWCDATEIDEMLALRVQTLTDEEKIEMRQVDDYARRILERTEKLSECDWTKLHGTLREVRSFDDLIFGSNSKLEGAAVDGIFLKTGDTVRIRPKVRADVLDIALAGKAAVIEAVEQDAEGKVHLALVLQADPGKDLGMMRQVGHRFFFGVDEVEPLQEDPT